MSEKVDILVVNRIVEELGRDASAVIPILQAVQKEFKYLPEAALRRVCEITDITPAQIEGVSSFYSQFRRTPAGTHMISVCDGTACHVKGAEAVYGSVLRNLGIVEGDTDADGLFTVQKVACLGCCSMAVAVQIDEVIFGHITKDSARGMIEDFLASRQAREESLPLQVPEVGIAGEIRIGMGSCCLAGGSAAVCTALKTELARLGCRVVLKEVACAGVCPMIEVLVPGDQPAWYAHVHPDDVPELVGRHFRAPHPVRRMQAAAEGWLRKLYSGRTAAAADRCAVDLKGEELSAFLQPQLRIATEYSGQISPDDLEEYKQLGGFKAAHDALLHSSPEQVIETVSRSGLRGRGGGGFPSGKKWNTVRQAAGGKKYIICNGDEGDPGAFMDRMILESYPYRVIEGLLIASYAIGADEGILYIRAEYPLAVHRMRAAIGVCEAAGLLGAHVFGSGHSLHLRVREGAGAFVCGEESALIASLEGRRGMPNFRPPFPAEKGLYGCPTLVNNAETCSLVPWILSRGAEAFAAIGTAESKGTKVFSLAGKVERGGLIEVPMGITIREIVEQIGGGVPEGRVFKAVQVGGPSGGVIPASMCEIGVDYEELTSVGAMMGSGGFVVLDDRDCMVELAHYFLSFTQNESCGKCTPCRVGTKRMLEILTRLCDGDGKPGDIEKLEQLSKTVKAQSLCGLGKTAPNPVLTTLHYFRDEFEAHIAGKCPAGKCKKLIVYSINDDCIGCAKCAAGCPVDAICGEPYSVFEIDAEKCVRCGACRETCPVDAVEVI
jgi:NADH:ubiquinone oxidoreductase subunit F (NADH-binding)/NADH:ubiquinone oxidoreductase subunit E/Pyruvate/2-oxoacid:ferredoxin oxidoreductase delta subunit